MSYWCGILRRGIMDGGGMVFGRALFVLGL